AKHDMFIQKSKALGKTSLAANSLQNLGSSDSLPQLEEKLIIDETIIKTPENPEPLKDLNKESKDNIDQDNDLPQDAPFGLATSKGNAMSQLNIEIVSGALLRRQRNKNAFKK
ncbi:MAG: hypothetical protein EZS28_031886, partial [Streblomastix strix]